MHARFVITRSADPAFVAEVKQAVTGSMMKYKKEAEREAKRIRAERRAARRSARIATEQERAVERKMAELAAWCEG